LPTIDQPLPDIEAILNELLRPEAAEQFNRAAAHGVRARKDHPQNPQKRLPATRHGHRPFERIRQPPTALAQHRRLAEAQRARGDRTGARGMRPGAVQGMDGRGPEAGMIVIGSCAVAVPGLPGRCLNLGTALEGLSRPDAAVAACREALKYRADAPLVRRHLAALEHGADALAGHAVPAATGSASG
jgi:hypothetical protein